MDSIQITGFLGPLSAALSALTWAIGVSIYSKMSASRPVFVVNFTRAATALPIFVFLVFSGGFHSGMDSVSQMHSLHFMWLSLSIIGSYALGDALFLMSSQTLGVPAALSIASCYPVWSAMAGWIFKGEHLLFHQVIGLFLIIGGVVTVILSRVARKKKTSQEASNDNYGKGIIFAVFVSLFWALNTYAVAKGSVGISSHLANAVRMGAAVVLCPCIGFVLVREWHWPFMPVGEYKKYLWVFVFEGFVGSFTYIYAFTHSSLAVAAALTSLAPALSVPIALITKSETLSKSRLAGIAMVVLGIAGLVTH